MREILDCIFKKYGFELKSFGEIRYYSSKVKSENYIVYHIDNLENVDIEETLENKIYTVAASCISKEYRKNTSVIFVAKVNDSELKDHEKKVVFKIEEEPFYYKKYVLWYTSEELKELEPYIKNMTHSLMNKELFQNMKLTLEGKEIEENLEKVHSYMLLCRIFIKLPFLSLKSIYSEADNNDLQNVEDKIISLFEKYENEDLELDGDIDLKFQLDENELSLYKEKIERDIEG